MLGAVGALRRYPVKSMLGEDVDETDVSWTGLARDRRLAVVSRTTGKIASAKYPRLWRDLLTASASAAASDDAVLITLPGGKTVWSTDAEVDTVLSELLDEPVTLTATRPPAAALDRAVPEAGLRAGINAQVPFEVNEIGAGSPPGTFVDFAPLHLLTTSTLDRIAELSPYRKARLERYRPNIVIRTSAPGFTENDWLERHLRIGEELTLRVVARTPRCAVPTLAHGDLPRDTEALRGLARHNRVEPLVNLNHRLAPVMSLCNFFYYGLHILAPSINFRECSYTALLIVIPHRYPPLTKLIASSIVVPSPELKLLIRFLLRRV